MEKIDYTSRHHQIALYAKALAHPARVAILEFLAARECCFFGNLHDVLPMPKRYPSTFRFERIRLIRRDQAAPGKVLSIKTGMLRGICSDFFSTI